jgi:hypothetical protein
MRKLINSGMVHSCNEADTSAIVERIARQDKHILDMPCGKQNGPFNLNEPL